MKILVAALCLLASSSVAAGELLSQYVSILGGIGTPAHSNIEHEDDALSGLFLGGVRPHPNAAYELGVGYTSVDLGNAAVDASRTLVPITLTAKAILPVSTLDLYALGGVGVYVARQYQSPRRIPPTDDQTSTDPTVGVHGGGGAALRLGDLVALTAEARYHVVRVELFDIRTRVDHLQLLGGLTFRF